MSRSRIARFAEQLCTTTVDAGVALAFRPRRHGILLELRGRASVEGTHQFVTAVHGLLRMRSRRQSSGIPWIALELERSGDVLRHRVWVPHGERDAILHLLRTSYPELEVVAVEPTSFDEPIVGVTTLALRRGPYLPIRASEDVDLLAGPLATIAAIEGHVLLQIELSPNRAWQARASAEAQRLRLHRSDGIVRPVRFGALDRAMARDIEKRATALGYDCVIRIVAGSASVDQTHELTRVVVASFAAYDAANGFVARRTRFGARALQHVETRAFPRIGGLMLTSDELATLWRMNQSDVSSAHLRFTHLQPPAALGARDRVVGTSSVVHEQRIGLSLADSRMHLHVLGPTGVGKSTTMLSLAEQDIIAGRGVGVLDPKGDLVAALLERIPRSRWEDVIYLSPDQDVRCIGINPLDAAGADLDLVCENTLSIFKRLYERYWGMRTDDILKVALRTMLMRGDATLAHIPLLLTDATFRARTTSLVDDAFVMSFWQWYDGLSDGRRTEAIGPVLNKLRDFLVRPRLRRLLCQVRSTVRLRDVVDGRKILLADLSIGRWGESAAELAGSFLMASLWQTILGRTASPTSERPDFFLYVDEFQKFQGVAMPFGDALAQARSLGLALTLANQNLGQLSRELRDAVSANARSRLVFQCGAEDASHLARTFAPLAARDLESLPRFHMAARLLVDGTVSPTVILRSLAPSDVREPGVAAELRRASLDRYGRPREDVDRELLATIRWLGAGPSRGLED